MLWISKPWLDSGLINFSIEFLNTLQVVELRLLTSRLFYSVITAGEKEFLN